jgi:ring-1,2-phenylacetyl-CoA epoxidase subunit PaaC
MTNPQIDQSTNQLNYVLQIADNALITGQRLSEWCGHGPILEQDIAITNIALDHIGTARTLCKYAAEIYNSLSPAEQQAAFTSPMLTQAYVHNGKLGEDDIAYLRDAWDFKNVLLTEQPNGDWAYTIARAFFTDTFNYYCYEALQAGNDETIAAVAEKALKEVTYHLKWSSEWVIRLGDGTEESHARMQRAINDRWAYTGELTTPSPADTAMQNAGIGIDLAAIKQQWHYHVRSIIEEATLTVPEEAWMQQGGKTGTHTEHLGYILAEMQYMQRAYPGMEW